MGIIKISASDSSGKLPDLKIQLKAVLDSFDSNGRIFYVDYPVHLNVGDMLINLGTEQFLLEHDKQVYKRYSLLNMPRFSSIDVDGNTTFLCQGGGNFGDLYPEHQRVRESLVKFFPQCTIIFLPQSIHYSSPEVQEESLKRLEQYSNYHIFVRDKESFDILESSGVVRFSLMPDMAHQLWGRLKNTSHPENGRNVYFLRKDQESTIVPDELSGLFAKGTVDWDDIISQPHTLLAGSIYRLLHAMSTILSPEMSASLWYFARDLMINDAITHFSRHEHVYTNRLHAMILALLLGHDVTAFDNTYGKLSRYANTWLPVQALSG